jgi:hypothetical protein
MTKIFRFPILFILISIISWVLINYLGVEFGKTNFWDKHGLFFLIFIAIFPRLTLLFSSVPFGGIFWWLGFFFAPRLLVAILATVNYWHQNPIWVTISWLVALGGEASEKHFIINRSQKRFHSHRPGTPEQDKNVIDAEYKVID